MRILIVEDNPDFLEILQEQLSNHQITTATDARSGSELIALKEFDLVITDLNMPGTGGGERIIQEANNRDYPVVVITVRDYLQTEYIKKLGAKKVFCKLGSISNLFDYVSQISA